MTQGLAALTAMDYPGRFIIGGRSSDDQWNFLLYGLTGRSLPSKARKFQRGATTGTILTTPTDEEQLRQGNRALLIYPALMHHKEGIVASNGAQTMLLYNRLRQLHATRINEEDQSAFLELYFSGEKNNNTDQHFERPAYFYDEHTDTFIDLNSYEPDAPHNTPRINAMLQEKNLCMHIVKKEPESEKPQHWYYRYSLNDLQGQGKLLATYDGKNENPLPSFQGATRTITHNWIIPEQAAEEVYTALPEPYKVGVATIWKNVKTGETTYCYKNKHQE